MSTSEIYESNSPSGVVADPVVQLMSRRGRSVPPLLALAVAAGMFGGMAGTLIATYLPIGDIATAAPGLTQPVSNRTAPPVYVARDVFRAVGPSVVDIIVAG